MTYKVGWALKAICLLWQHGIHSACVSNPQVPYDHLVLSTGQQFQAPAPTGADIEAGDTNDTLPNNPNNRLLTQPPKNLYLINDAYDAAVALYRAENIMMKNPSELLKESFIVSWWSW